MTGERPLLDHLVGACLMFGLCVGCSSSDAPAQVEPAPAAASEVEPAPSAAHEAPDPAPAAAEDDVRAEVSAPTGMVHVPGRTYTLGARDEPERVELQSFYLDVEEVRVADYERCVKAGQCRQTHGGSLHIHREPDQAVNFVDLDRAQAYCAWAGKRLPTTNEWEAAARGADGRRFPWGDEPPGDGLEDISPVGARDLWGGLSEWVDEGHWRGGSHVYVLDGADGVAARQHTPTKAQVEVEGAFGIRCARGPR